ncbi:putative polygalacturonase [Vitis vinifera]|uniref:Putative polygalacturonase n=1 Tax=Vitis vinifera TaxID=29760 RepID=A0A438D9T0_VITVI|nr:putative polygalacturonase [Vitis vinifera]RVW84388.1 putative polygalacturonase [Vitis vinifera]
MDSLSEEMDKLMARLLSGSKLLQLGRYMRDLLQKNHVKVSGSNGATISNLTITAPDSSPNTDGIDISDSTNIHIYDSTIGTGDDCIALSNQTSQVYVKGVVCGPGHGISVGSLGMNGGSAQVEEIHVDTCSFKGTQNGARIKKSAVQISDVSFTEFWGTSATDDAIKLSCIETVGCANITVDDISIKSASGNGETYSCINAHGTVNKTFPPLT